MTMSTPSTRRIEVSWQRMLYGLLYTMVKPPPMQPHRLIPLGLLVTALLAACATVPTPPESPPAPVEIAHPDMGHEHIPVPGFPHTPYNSNPPSSGAHTAYTGPWGVHQAPLAPEIWLHNLEHGGVVINYRCDGACPELVEGLKAVAGQHALIIITPAPYLNHRVALAAWGHTLSFDVLNGPAKAAAMAFIERHHGIDHHPPGNHSHTAPPANRAPSTESPHSGHLK